MSDASSVGVGHESAPALSKTRAKVGLHTAKRYREVYLLLIPGFVYFVLLWFIPAVGNVLFAMINYHPLRGFFGSEWVGLEHFRRLFAVPELARMLRNTFVISGMRLLYGFPVPIILSLLLNDVDRNGLKRTFQNIIYLPHFLSWVVVATITLSILAPDGLLNAAVEALGGQSRNYMIQPQYFRWILVFQGIWKDAGWGTVIYLAALSNVDPNLYEAAEIDGCTRLQRTRYITFPAILGTAVVVFLLAVGRLVNENFQQIFLMLNPIVLDKGDVFETYIFRVGIESGQFGYATAVGLFKSVVAFVMVVGANWLIRQTGQRGIY
jgi:putative aldouronate transport system permease protein